MDFLDPQKKREHTIKLFIGYFLVAVALFLAAVILLFASFGYGINRSTGEVIQNGLLFVDAHPEQASIYINGQERGQTDGRYVLLAGNYNVELRREGYRSWKRDFTLDGGIIVRLVYPFLFPEKLTSKDVVALNATPDLVTQSPDRRWLVIHQPNALGSFQVMDTASKEYEVKPAVVPAALFQGKPGAQRLEMVEWSTDNRHVLLKHSYEGGHDFIMFDREKPELSYSVNQTFGRSYATVALRDKKFDQLYVLNAPGGQLQAANVKDKSVTPVISDVQSFWPYKENTLLYATTAEAPAGKALIKLKDGQVTYTVREVVSSPSYLLNFAEFDGDSYLVAGATADGKTYIYQNVRSQLDQNKTKPPVPTTLLRVDNAEYLTFSANARFIALQGGSAFSVYDLETEKHYKYDTKLALAPKQKATWMDGHRLMVVSQGKMTVFDYDNLNRQTLVTADPNFLPVFDRDYDELFTISPSTKDASKPVVLSTDINLGEE